MEIKYQINSARYGVDITFTYADNGYLIGLEIIPTPELSPEEFERFLFNLPKFKDAFLAHCTKHKIKYTEVLPDVTFKTFWDKYQYKDGGSKLKAEAAFNKLNETERSKAIAYIKKYDQTLRLKNIAKAYATTYINGQYWNNG